MQSSTTKMTTGTGNRFSQRRCHPHTALRVIAVVFAASVTGLVEPAMASDGTKADNTDNLNLGTAWIGGVIPDATGWGIWDSTLTAERGADLGADATWGGVKVTSAAYKGTISATAGQSLTLTGIGGIGIDMSQACADFAVASPLTLGSSQTFAVTNARTLTISGAIGDGNNRYVLTKQGGGTLALNGTNTYSGGTTLNGGLLAISNANALGTGPLTVNVAAGGTWGDTSNAVFLAVFNNDAVSLTNAIALPASSTAKTCALVKTSSGLTAGTQLALAGILSGGNTNTTLLLNSNTTGDNTTTYCFNGANTFRATVNLNRGAIVVGNSQGLGDAANLIVLNGNGNTTLGDLRFAAPVSLANPIQLSNPVSPINTDTNNVSFLGAVSGTAPFTKLGNGTLTLYGVNTYTNVTTVNSGKLVGVTGGSSASSAVTVSSGTGNTLGVSITDNTKPWGCANLTFSSGTTALEFNFGLVTPSATLAPLKINGSLAFNSTPAVTVRGFSLPVGTYPLMTWSGTRSGTAPTTVALPSRVSGYLSVSGSTNYLTITASTQPLRWAVDGDGTWDISTTRNWKDSAGTDTYYLETATSGDSVLLDETYVTSSPTITLDSTVSPAGVTVTNATRNYTVSGTGAISGGTGLIKQGDGTLTLKTTNTYSGVTAINGGTLSVATLANGGSPSGIGASSGAAANLVIGGGATLRYTGDSAASDRGFTLGSGGGTVDVSEAGQTLTLSGTATGAYAFTKAGAGNLAFSTANALSAAGSVTVAAGDLQVGAWTLGLNKTNTLNAGATFTSTGSVQIPASTFISAAGNFSTLVAGAGTWRLRAANTSAATPDIYAPNDDLDRWGIRITAPIDTGNSGTSRYVAGFSQNCNPCTRNSAHGGDLIFAGSLMGAGNLCFFGTPRAATLVEMAFMLNADNSGFTGGVTLGRGELFLNNAKALTAANSVLLAPEAGFNATLRAWNTNVTVGALSSGGTGKASVVGTGPRAALTVAQDTDSTFGGALTQQNAVGGSYASGSTLSFTKDGTGVLTLEGINTYLGPTTVKAGTLRIDGLGVLGGGTYTNTIRNDAVFDYRSSAAQTLSGVISGTGAVVKTGSGSLTLSGANTFSGDTTINAGKLIGAVGASCANSAVTVNSGAGNTLGIAIADNTKQWGCANLTFRSGTTALEFNFGSATPSAVLAPLKVNGSLAFNGTPTVVVKGSSFPVGTYPLFTWGASLSGTAPDDVILPPHLGGNLSLSGTTVYLNITSASTQPVRWALAESGTWDINASQNWKDSAGTLTYYLETAASGDSVLLDETYITSSPTITLNSTVIPANVTVNNATQGYTISGSGAIAGDTGLTKQGNGTLTLNTANTYSGGTTISGGTLSVPMLANGG